MADSIVFMLVLAPTILIDFYCNYRYGYPVLSVGIALAKHSKRFKVLAFNVFGDDDKFYSKVYKEIKG